jgi:hypothetical protein
VAQAMAAGSVLVESVRFTDRHFRAGLPSENSSLRKRLWRGSLSKRFRLSTMPTAR